MQTVNGNILDYKRGIICHQTNSRGVMGAGIAKQIRNKYPRVYAEYVKLVEELTPKGVLGRCQLVEVIPKQLLVANLFGQFNYGRGKRYTDYGALSTALRHLSKWHQRNCTPDFPIYIPYKMGCSLAGGDWSVVSGVINGTVPNAIIVSLNRG